MQWSYQNFHELITRCRDLPENRIGRHTGSAYFLFQFHMVTRLDDVANFKCDNIMVNMELPFTLKSKMLWSKNVLEERVSPDKFIIESMDPNYCPTWPGITLETHRNTQK